MKNNDLKLICIKDSKSGMWTVFPKIMPGLIVEVKNPIDAASKLSKMYKSALLMGFNKNTHEYYLDNEIKDTN